MDIASPSHHPRNRGRRDAHGDADRGSLKEVGGRGPERTGDDRSPPPRLLVISYFFPPDGAVGGLRWGGMTKYLARRGWTIDVMTAAHVDRQPVRNGVRVHPVRKFPTLNDLYRRFAESSDDPSGEGATGSRGDSSDRRPSKRSLIHRFRRTLAITLRYPGSSRGWILKAALSARRIISRESIDVVVSSGPPHTSHLVAALATIGSNVRWIIDLRDPWSGVTLTEVPGFLLRTTAYLEATTFQRADALICNTRPYAEELRERYPEQTVHWIPNGIDLESLPNPVTRRAKRRVTLAYVGTLYFNRDLGPILEAMDSFLGQEPDQDLKLVFAGYASPAHAATFDRQLAASGLGRKHVERLGPVPQAEARQILQHADLSVVLAQGQPLQVPAKLYECVGMGIPTLVIAEPGSASADEAERIGALWRAPSDTRGIGDVLRQLCQGEIGPRSDAAERFDYEFLAGRVGAVLRQASD